MSWIEKRRQSLLLKILDISMQYGLRLYYESDQYNIIPPVLWASWPEIGEDRSMTFKHGAATKTLNALSQKNYRAVKDALKFARKTVSGLDAYGTLAAKIDAEALDAIRNEAMVKLYQSGRDEDPVFALLAGATTLDQVLGISREIEKKELAGRNRYR